VGGGFAGLFCVRELLKCDVQVVLLDRNNFHTFQPLLYQVATGGLVPESIAYPLRKSFKRDKKVFFRVADVKSIETEINTIHTDVGYLKYDYLVIATGSVSNFFGLDDIRQNAFPLKTLSDALRMRRAVLQRLEKALLLCDEAEIKRTSTFVVVGGGPTGVEVAGALAELRRYIIPADFPELPVSHMSIHLLEGSSQLLPGMSARASAKAKQFLEELGVVVHLNSIVTAYDSKTVLTKSAERIDAATVIWAAGVQGSSIDGLDSALVHTSKRLETDRTNKVKGYKNVFAIGDIAALVDEANPRGYPMLAPVAIQQGQQLGRNICRSLAGEEMLPFAFHDRGTMATVGRNKAVADTLGTTFTGIFAWFMWMFVHLMFLIGFRNKVAVFLDWFWNYLNYGQGTRLVSPSSGERNANSSR